MKKHNPQMLIVPSEEVDTFWHMHILDTRKYASDCDYIFGYFLHHNPYLGTKNAEDLLRLENLYAETKELYTATFGCTVPNQYASAFCASCGTD